MTKVNISDWKQFGEGGFGDSYYHVTDPSLMLKMYKANRNQDLAEQEFQRANAVYDIGIPTPRALEQVTDGERSGIIFERLQEKKSFSRLVAENPLYLEEGMAEFARMSRHLHSTQCRTDLFPSQKEVIYNAVHDCPLIEEAQKPVMLKAIEELPDATTCLHGDFHIGNAVRSLGKSYFIDLGDFAYGDPRLDIAEFKLPVFLMREERTQEIFHMSKELLQRCWKSFLGYYYETSSEAEIDEIDNSLNRLLAIDIAFMATKISSTKNLYPIALKLLG